MELTINDIRKKRLEFYNKSVQSYGQSTESTYSMESRLIDRPIKSKKDENSYSNFDRQQNVNHFEIQRSYSLNQKSRNNTATTTNNSNEEKIENTLESILSSFNEKTMRQNRKQSNFDRSYSLQKPSAITQSQSMFDYDPNMESTTAVVTKNKKLDQFKKIVDASYKDHVINKPDNTTVLFFDKPPTDFKYQQQQSEQNSFHTSSSRSQMFENSTNQDVSLIMDSHRPSSMLNGRLSSLDNEYSTSSNTPPYKIQYMSAYNIYEPPSPQQQQPLLNSLPPQPPQVDEILKKSSRHRQIESLNLDALLANSDSNYDLKTDRLYESSKHTISIDQMSSRRSSTAGSMDNNMNNNKIIRSPLHSDEYMRTASNSSSSTSPNFKSPMILPLSSRLEPLKPIQLQKSPIEVKPPSTKPSTQMPTYRKSLAKRQLGASTEILDKYKADKVKIYTSAYTVRTQVQSNPYEIKTRKSTETSLPNTTNVLNTSQTKKAKQKSPYEIRLTDNSARLLQNNRKNSNPLLSKSSISSTARILPANTSHEEKENYRKVENILQKANEIFDSLDGVDVDETDDRNNKNNQTYTVDEKKVQENFDDCEDTLDILSNKDMDDENGSDLECDDIIEIKHQQPQQSEQTIKKFDLNINLDDLSGDDEPVRCHHDEDYDDKNYDDKNEFELILNKTSPTAQQIKPSCIPNLLLDFNEDERSVSVAASLAISMCNGIDYKNEMENLLNTNTSYLNVPKHMVKQQSHSPLLNVNNNNTNLDFNVKQVYMHDPSTKQNKQNISSVGTLSTPTIKHKNN